MLQAQEGLLQEPQGWPLPEDAIEAYAAIRQAIMAGELATFQAATADTWWGWPPTGWVMQGINYLHASGGLPWWAAIAGLQVVIKACMFPAAAYNQRLNAKMMMVQMLTMRINTANQASLRARTPEERQRLQETGKALRRRLLTEYPSQVRISGHMMGMMVANGAVFLTVFQGVRSLMTSQVHSITQGGTLWFTDLSQPDAYYGLPLLCALSMAAVVYRNMSPDGTEMAQSQNQKYLKYFMYFMSTMFIWAGGYMPAGIGILWVVNSCFNLGQSFLVKSPKFRKVVGLPTIEEMAEIRKQVAEAQADMTNMTTKAAVEYDPARAAEELVKRVGVDATGKPVLYTHNPTTTGTAGVQPYLPGHRARRR